MSTDTAPSFRTEAFYAAIAELAQFPEAHEAVLKKLDAGVQTIKAQPKSSGNSTALKGWQENLVAFSRGKRLAPTKAPKAPEEPTTMWGKIRAASQPVSWDTIHPGRIAPKPPASDDLDEKAISALVDDTVRADEAKAKRLGQSVTNLANKLGEALEGISKANFDTFASILTRLKPGEDPQLETIDVEPRLVRPLDLVPDGEGEDFEPGKLILFIPSYDVYVEGVLIKRDYRLNGKPAVQTHPQVIRLDSNLKIRSTKKQVNGKQAAFYAKAFWVKDGDALYGYLNLDQKDKDEENFSRHYRITGGKLVSR